jgi:plastocyanin
VAGSSALLVCAAPAQASVPLPELVGVTPLGAGVQRFHYRYGPLEVVPGQNLILIGPVTIEKPDYPGYAIRVKPDLVRADGSVPGVDVIHLHHAVWLNLSHGDITDPGTPERFFATGEEKTIATAPPGYGYPVKPSDVWAINYMLHNQTAAPETLWITYDVDFVPKDSRLGRAIMPVRPLWFDVRNGQAYPVFDVHRGSGGADQRFTYPDEAKNPYGDGRRQNVWTADRSGALVGAAGHVHPGGLSTDLALQRNGRSARIFRSQAKYYDPRGPISWDLSMTTTDPGWRVGIRKGDRLRLSATYESRRASWYESMGIDYAWLAEGEHGPNPFRSPIDTLGHVTHGHLPENGNYGGRSQGAPDPRALPDGQTLGDGIGIADFQYLPGGLGLTGSLSNPPVVKPGQQLSFYNFDSPAAGTLHTVTSCRAPCNASTGISYPLANGPVDFDSGDLGYGPQGFSAAANRSDWKIPSNLQAGTYTYFCRIHPFMRGAFRVRQR